MVPLRLLTVANLIIAVSTIGLSTVKALALRRQRREWSLRLTASVLICAGIIFLLATPGPFRLVGALLHSPNICALIVPAATLACVAHAHALSQLWQPDKSDPASLRRTAWRWGPVYGGAITAMTALFFHAPLGPAAPLKFAAVYAHVPEVVALHLVYWSTLILTVVVTVRECRKVTIPGRPELREHLARCMAAFGLALGLDLVNVVLTATALFGTAAGPHRLDALAESAWLATIASCIAANAGLGAMVLYSRRAERRDKRLVTPLHDLVVRNDPAAQADPSIVLAPRWSLWAGFNTAMELTSVMAELEDGFGRLSPWWSALAPMAVTRLAQDQPDGRQDAIADDTADIWDLTAAQVAATLLYAAHARNQGLPALPPQIQLTRLPGSDTEPHAWRQHLVRVSQHLDHPVVTKAVTLVSKAQEASPTR
ncbi:hypothetical protein AB0F77_31975 [Streptomyces sp. NPDC026672]|uniref:hypothetical protein n=1 Tax=unclassified Streptomyces TaxID=2593676 RepID=UPI00340D217E